MFLPTWHKNSIDISDGIPWNFHGEINMSNFPHGNSMGYKTGTTVLQDRQIESVMA